MLRYTPGETLLHRLDPRSKLAFQFGFAVAVFTAPTVPWLPALTAIALGSLVAGDLSVRRVLGAYRVVLAVLALGPILAGVTLGQPWFRPAPALASSASVARVVPVLFVSGAYIHSTPVGKTRAVIQRTIPGRVGQLLGIGVSLTFRLVPLLREDVRRIRAAIQARGGSGRPARDRVRRVVGRSVLHGDERVDRLTVALQARCFAWNPTLPSLQMGRADVVVLGVGLGLGLTPLVGLVS